MLFFSYLSSTARRWELFGGGFAPLHWHLSHPVCFLTGPRITEVSLSGSTEKLLLQFSRYTVQFRVCRPLLEGAALAVTIVYLKTEVLVRNQ